MECRDNMLDALKAKRYDDIYQYLALNQAKGKESDLKESFEILTKGQSNAFWDLLWSNNKTIIERIGSTAISFQQGNETPSESDVTILRCVMDSMMSYCQASKYKPASMFDILHESQNILTINCDNTGIVALKSVIGKLYELWWLNNDEGAENLMPSLLTYLMLNSLSAGAHDVDIKRLFLVRGGFLLLDFEAESFSFIRDLLQRCFVHPTFLKVKEGQKLLAFLLNVHEGALVESVVAVIKPQLATGSKPASAAYGKIFYHAWLEFQASVGEDGAEAESSAASAVLEDAVQCLLRECIHASEDKYFKGVRFMLQAFHDVQRTKLDPMLLRVYDPILWRSLRCAHAKVRAQAAVVFLDVFPLQHADGRAEDNDKILQKQFDLLAALLKDADHEVRAHAALGVCHILKEYWEALPLNTTHNILKYLVDTLSVDASCANVRHAVFVGLGELFQQPLTHALLKQLLPLLKNSIHDKAEKVRVAFIRILCQIKGVRGMHFYDIVPVDHLLERMAQDRQCPAVCRVMTELLLNSFYPQADSSMGGGGPETEQLNRCMQFVSRNPVAAEVFYANLRSFASIGHVAKLMTVLFTFLVTAEARCSRDAEPDSDAPEAGGKRRRAPKMVAVQVAFPVKLGLMRVILKMLESVQGELRVQHPARELICKYMTEEHACSLVMAAAASTAGDGTQALHLLPAAFQLVAFSVSLRALSATSCDAKSGERAPQGGDRDLTPLLSEVYCPVWSSVSASSASSVQVRSALAKSLVQIFRGAVQSDIVLEVIASTCEGSWGQAENSKSSKKGKKVGGLVASPLLSVDAAVDLLLAFDHEELAADACSQVTGRIFSSVRVAIERMLGKVDSLRAVSPTCLTAVLNFWMAHCVHSDAARAVFSSSSNSSSSAEEARGGIEQFSATKEILRWASEHLLPALSSSGTEACQTLSQQLLGMVLAALGDLFYLDLHDEPLCSAARDLLCEVHCRLKDMLHSRHAITTAGHSSLFHALGRLAVLLSKAPAGECEYVSELSVPVMDALLQHLDHNDEEAGEQDKTTKTVTALLCRTAPSLLIEHALVLLLDEVEASVATGAKKSSNSLHNMLYTTSGHLLLRLVAGEDLRHRASSLLTSWQEADPSCVPYSIRNPVARVAQSIVSRLAEHVTQQVPVGEEGKKVLPKSKTAAAVVAGEALVDENVGVNNKNGVQNATILAVI